MSSNRTITHLDVGRTNARLNACDPEFVSAFAGRHSSPPLPFNTEKSGEVVLPCVSVPDLMAFHAIDHLDVLHCDAQGVELDVLEAVWNWRSQVGLGGSLFRRIRTKLAAIR